MRATFQKTFLVLQRKRGVRILTFRKQRSDSENIPRSSRFFCTPSAMNPLARPNLTAFSKTCSSDDRMQTVRQAPYIGLTDYLSHFRMCGILNLQRKFCMSGILVHDQKFCMSGMSGILVHDHSFILNHLSPYEPKTHKTNTCP